MPAKAGSRPTARTSAPREGGNHRARASLSRARRRRRRNPHQRKAKPPRPRPRPPPGHGQWLRPMPMSTQSFTVMMVVSAPSIPSPRAAAPASRRYRAGRGCGPARWGCRWRGTTASCAFVRRGRSPGCRRDGRNELSEVATEVLGHPPDGRVADRVVPAQDDREAPDANTWAMALEIWSKVFSMLPEW